MEKKQPDDRKPFEAPQPKEKQADSPATSENEQARLRQEQAAADERKAAIVDPEGHLLPALQALQARSEKEPAPRVARLVVPKKDEMGNLPAEPPSPPPPDAGGPVPRLIHENERAPKGLTRYRIREDGEFGRQPMRYVLARGPEEAMRYYLRATGIDTLVEALGERAPGPRLSVVRLPD